MAPSINDILPEQYAPLEVKSSKSRVLRPSDESSEGQAERGAVGYDAASAPNVEEMPLFNMPSMQKLRQAQWRVEHDFRSDTVTVPTVNMMQVCKNCPSLQCPRERGKKLTISTLKQYKNISLTSRF
jgi:threonine aldolase